MLGDECLEKEERRRRGREETRGNSIFGEGIIPVEPRLNQQERVPGKNGNVNTARGRSRSYPAPPQNIFRSQPHSQPCCLTVEFRYVAPTACLPSRINPPILPCFQLTLSLPESLLLPFPNPSTPSPKPK